MAAKREYAELWKDYIDYRTDDLRIVGDLFDIFDTKQYITVEEFLSVVRSTVV